MSERKRLKEAGLILSGIIGSGLALGRGVASREIEKRKTEAIAAAVESARVEIRERAQTYLSEQFLSFAFNTAVKGGVLLAIWAAFRLGVIGPSVFAWAIGVALTVFVLRDVWRTFPTARLLVVELRRNNWNPKRALSEVVAANVFETVVERAGQTKINLTGRVTLMLAGKTPGGLAREVATAVADVARSITWKELTPFIWSAAIRFAVLGLVYAGFVWLVLAAT